MGHKMTASEDDGDDGIKTNLRKMIPCLTVSLRLASTPSTGWAWLLSPPLYIYIYIYLYFYFFIFALAFGKLMADATSSVASAAAVVSVTAPEASVTSEARVRQWTRAHTNLTGLTIPLLTSSHSPTHLTLSLAGTTPRPTWCWTTSSYWCSGVTWCSSGPRRPACCCSHSPPTSPRHEQTGTNHTLALF